MVTREGENQKRFDRNGVHQKRGIDCKSGLLFLC